MLQFGLCPWHGLKDSLDGGHACAVVTGAKHGQELPPERMEALIRAAGRAPRQRTTLYGSPPREQQAKSYGAAPLSPVEQLSLSYAEAMGLQQQPALSHV